MQPRSIEPKVPPKIEAAQLVPDPTLDALFRLLETHRDVLIETAVKMMQEKWAN